MTAIPGATSSTYVPVTADIGQNITCTVTATNSAGNASATSAGVGPVAGIAPVNIALPTISGVLVLSNPLTATTGTWTGTPTPTYAYQWLRGGVTIAGATSSSYTLVSADVGTMTSVAVTATNSAGNATATSTQVGPISATGGTIWPALVAQFGAFPYAGATMTVVTDYSLVAQNGAFAFNGFSAVLSTTAGAGVYTGPGDVSGWGTAYGYWGLRAYNSTKIGANCVDVCTNYTGAAAGLVTVKIGTNGYADFSGIGFSPIYLQKIYDQAGTQDLTIPSGPGRAVIVPNQVGGKPAIEFDAGCYYPAAGTAAAHPQPLSIAAIVNNGVGSATGAVVTDGTAQCIPMFFNNTNLVIQNGGITNSSYTCPEGTYHSLISVLQGVNGATSSMSVNGTITTSPNNIGSNGFGTTNKLTIGGTDSGGFDIGPNTFVYEVLIKDGAVATGDQASLTSNQRSIGTGF